MQLTEKNMAISTALANAFIRLSVARSSLLLNHAEFNIFDQLQTKKQDVYSLHDQPFPDIGVWDIVLGNFPFGLRTINTDLAKFSRLPTYTAAATTRSLQLLSENGYGIFHIEPPLLKNERFREFIKTAGFSIVAILNTPEDFLRPYTGLRSIFIVLKKGYVEKEFVGEIESIEQVEMLVKNYFSNNEGGNLSAGIRVTPNEFTGFKKWKIHQQIAILDSEYKGFSEKILGDIALAMNRGSHERIFGDISNSIYIHGIGTSRSVISNLAKLPLKQQHYFQVVCDPNVADADYLAAFFDSRLGKLIIDSLPEEGWIPRIRPSDILETKIALPPIESQKNIVNSIRKLRQIKDKISSFEDNLALNPISSERVLSQIDSMLEVVGELAVADKIRSAIRTGESKNVEFKETLSLNTFTREKDSKLEDVVIKTIAAFLNSEGGLLLVGVHDSGKMTGLEAELDKFYKGNKDKFLLHFKNLFANDIGGQYYPFIEHNLITIESQLILYVDCKKSKAPVYVKEKDFYVRTNPATDKLEGSQLVEYVRNHFNN